MFLVHRSSQNCCEDICARVCAIVLLTGALLCSLPSFIMYAIAASKADNQKALIGAGAAFSLILAVTQAGLIWFACGCGCCDDEGRNPGTVVVS